MPKYSQAGASRSALYLADGVSAFISGPWGSFSSFALRMFFWPLQACNGRALVFSHKLCTFSFFVTAIIISCDIFKSLFCSSWNIQGAINIQGASRPRIPFCFQHESVMWTLGGSPASKAAYQWHFCELFRNMCEKVIITHNYVKDHLNVQFYQAPSHIYFFTCK